jgi:hypothetical protein
MLIPSTKPEKSVITAQIVPTAASSPMKPPPRNLDEQRDTAGYNLIPAWSKYFNNSPVVVSGVDRARRGKGKDGYGAVAICGIVN